LRGQYVEQDQKTVEFATINDEYTNLIINQLNSFLPLFNTFILLRVWMAKILAK